jgi:PAS domain S-box-containing protein
MEDPYELPTAEPARRRGHVVPLFVAMALLLAATLSGTFWVWRLGVNNGAAMRAEQGCLSSLQTMLDTLKDAETGQRGFIITGDETYLTPYNAGTKRIPDNLSALKNWVDAGELRREDFDFLAGMTEQKLDEMKTVIGIRRAKGLDAAVAKVQTNAGKQTMDAIRDRIRSLSVPLQAEIENRAVFRDSVRSYHNIAFAITTILNLGFLAWALGRVLAEMHDREAAARDVLQQKILLSVTLSSIGDGVIVTDADARIVFMNKVAEDLTGWTRSQAVGKPCATVFAIISESTRRPMNNPVEKVLRTGVVVGLANHTLLIRRDGSEIPIDDSGAPIRGPDGRLHGVVLVFRDFSEHKEVERKLQKAKEEAETANAAKDNFLAALSHELRTPLTPVLTTLTAWETDGELPESLHPTVQLLRRNVELEARLIDDLLDLTRIVKGKLQLNLEVVDVHQLIGHVAEMYQSEIRGRRLKVSMELAAGEHYVNADSARLAQVMWNIIKNATKFTPEGGIIEVRTTNDEKGRVRIAVSDNGIGMDRDMLKRVFRPFEQGDHQLVKRSGGLGLGLAISKALVEAQFGEIGADSPGIGQGSSFIVTLPSVPKPRAGEEPPKTVPLVTNDERRYTILLVEDHADTGRVMSRLLQSRGHQVILAESVAAALSAAAAQNFDLLLSDIGLGDGTGIDLIRKLRQDRGGEIPAIALTGFGMEEDVVKCREAGFSDHLTKPISFQKLEAAISRVGAMVANSTKIN